VRCGLDQNRKLLICREKVGTGLRLKRRFCLSIITFRTQWTAVDRTASLLVEMYSRQDLAPRKPLAIKCEDSRLQSALIMMEHHVENTLSMSEIANAVGVSHACLSAFSGSTLTPRRLVSLANRPPSSAHKNKANKPHCQQFDRRSGFQQKAFASLPEYDLIAVDENCQSGTGVPERQQDQVSLYSWTGKGLAERESAILVFSINLILSQHGSKLDIFLIIINALIFCALQDTDHPVSINRVVRVGLDVGLGVGPILRKR
jgi:hypothetical protein